MNTRLGNIADIQFGSSARKKKGGKLTSIQVSNLNRDGSINSDDLVFVDESKVDESDYLKEGDLLLPAKGNRFTVATVASELLQAVASSSLFVIRVIEENTLPQYLQWYLNLPKTQWELRKYATGTNITSLSIRDLRKLKLSLPSLDTQRKIFELQQLQSREGELLKEIGDKRNKLINKVSKEIITEEINNE